MIYLSCKHIAWTSKSLYLLLNPFKCSHRQDFSDCIGESKWAEVLQWSDWFVRLLKRGYVGLTYGVEVRVSLKTVVYDAGKSFMNSISGILKEFIWYPIRASGSTIL